MNPNLRTSYEVSFYLITWNESIATICWKTFRADALPYCLFSTAWQGGHVGGKNICFLLLLLFFNRTCMKKNVSLQRRELSAFVLHHQHGRRDVSWKPAIREIKFSRLSSRINNPESFTVLFFTTKVSSLISVEGGKALSRSLYNRISNIW